MANYNVYVDETSYQVTIDESSQSIIIRSQGTQGPVGAGVPVGGDTGFLLAKASGVDLDTEWIDPATVGVTDHGALTGLSDDDHSQYHNDSRALTWLGTRSTSDVAEGSNLYFTNERVDDRVNGLLVQGTGVTLTYNDVANTLTIDGSGATIGDAIGGGTAGEVLYGDASANLDSDPSFKRLQDDEQSVKIFSKVKASYFYDDGVQLDGFVADFAGTGGNSIALIADGIDDWATIVANWNAANPANTVTQTEGAGTDIPDAGTYTFAGGNNTAGFASGVYANVPEFAGLGLGIETPISATETALTGIYNYTSILGIAGTGAVSGTIDFTNNINNVSIVGDGLVYNIVSDGTDTAYHLIYLDAGNTILFNNTFLGIDSSEDINFGNGSNKFILPKTSTPDIGDVMYVSNVSGTIHTLDFTTLPTLAAGTYSPTISGILNVTSSSLISAMYQRVGTIVDVNVEIDVVPTATSITTIEVSLPVASNFTATSDATGIVTHLVGSTNVLASGVGNIATDKFSISFNGTASVSNYIKAQFKYEIK